MGVADDGHEPFGPWLICAERPAIELSQVSARFIRFELGLDRFAVLDRDGKERHRQEWEK